MDQAGIPADEAVVVPADSSHPLAGRLPKFVLTKRFVQYFSNLRASVETKPTRQATLRYDDQSAAIAITPLPIGSVRAGIWRVSFTLAVQQAASVSSSVDITVTWTQDSLTKTETAAAIVNGVTTSVRFGTVPLRPDANTPISIATSYASVGATPMKYALDACAEEVAPDGL